MITPKRVVLTHDEAQEIELRMLIGSDPLESGEPYVLIVLDSNLSSDERTSMVLTAGGFLEPVSVYAMSRSVMAAMATEPGVAQDVLPRVRAAIRTELVEAGVAKGTDDDAPWLVRLLDRLVELAVYR